MIIRLSKKESNMELGRAADIANQYFIWVWNEKDLKASDEEQMCLRWPVRKHQCRTTRWGNEACKAPVAAPLRG